MTDRAARKRSLEGDGVRDRSQEVDEREFVAAIEDVADAFGVVLGLLVLLGRRLSSRYPRQLPLSRRVCQFALSKQRGEQAPDARSGHLNLRIHGPPESASTPPPPPAPARPPPSSTSSLSALLFL